jgi:hypothetical protein
MATPAADIVTVVIVTTVHPNRELGWACISFLSEATTPIATRWKAQRNGPTQGPLRGLRQACRITRRALTGGGFAGKVECEWQLRIRPRTILRLHQLMMIGAQAGSKSTRGLCGNHGVQRFRRSKPHQERRSWWRTPSTPSSRSLRPAHRKQVHTESAAHKFQTAN